MRDGVLEEAEGVFIRDVDCKFEAEGIDKLG